MIFQGGVYSAQLPWAIWIYHGKHHAVLFNAAVIAPCLDDSLIMQIAAVWCVSVYIFLLLSGVYSPDEKKCLWLFDLSGTIHAHFQKIYMLFLRSQTFQTRLSRWRTFSQIQTPWVTKYEAQSCSVHDALANMLWRMSSPENEVYQVPFVLKYSIQTQL